MLKKITAALLVLMTAVFFVYAKGTTTGKVEVITTLFPTYDFVRQIGKDKVNVHLLLPPGVEPHTFEPKPQDIVKINRADIFVYTGKYMEPWVEELLQGIPNKNLEIVDASTGISLISEKDDDNDGHEEHGEHSEHHDNKEHHHHHAGKDPHIWLDFDNDKIMVDTIVKALCEKDSDNKDFYMKNAEEYKNKLTDLDKRFKETLSTAKHRTIIYGGHFAFGYFAKRYGLEHDSPYEGFSPNAEPSPKVLGELIKKLKASGIKYIYYEELLDPKVARTISEATGAKLELLHGAHNVSKSELEKGITFISIMENNLKKLKEGLECR
ncbi:MAG: metal ABC transporter solute-binding protein, Zn/Mn family [Endomicrobiaceae bacterium]